MFDTFPNAQHYQSRFEQSRRKFQLGTLISEEDNPYDTKIGGRPYWPEGKAWPTAAGKPLYFLAQVNFEQMRPLAHFPAEGILLFFIEGDDSSYGMNFSDRLAGNYKLVFFEHIDVDCALNAAGPSIENAPESPVKTAYGVDFYEKEEYVGITCIEFEQLFGQSFHQLTEALPDAAARNAFYKKYTQNIRNTGVKMGGYPHFTQDDPRYQTCYAAYDTLLLQIDSVGDIMWGDAGVLQFFIRTEDLEAKCFDDVLFTWDCH